MSRLRNGSALTGAILIASMVLFSATANAQNVDAAPVAAPQQTPPVESVTAGAPVKAADETAAAFLARVNSTSPDMVTLAAAELFKQSPTQATVKDLIALASGTDAAGADLTGKVASGFPIIAVSTSAAQLSEQLSALVLSDSSQLPTIVALAQKVANKDFSEVVGEGLALAYSTAMQNGNTILAAAIQLQTKAAGVPSDLLIAFSENIEGTAAGPAAAAPAAAAAASPIGGAGSSPASDNSVGGSATTASQTGSGSAQSGDAGAPAGRGRSLSTGSTSTPVSTSPV
ncbi:hypothetical protein [Agrobacterium sp. NPDC089420]|uniref:hypothetical protein n=1 Tax=Agrobacterium sp. NPDC089420 TaxID=3363918 RepID=UPI00384BC7BB